MQVGFYFDQTACLGCGMCTRACLVEHDTAVPLTLRRIIGEPYVEWPPMLSLSCLHCAEPPCAAVCPTKAITKRAEDGIVVVDAAKCQGGALCTLCRDYCPYSIPQFGSEPDDKMRICNLCNHRLQAGRKPACVVWCSVSALDAGPMEYLIAKYGENREAVGFVYSAEAKPSIVLKAQQDS